MIFMDSVNFQLKLIQQSYQISIGDKFIFIMFKHKNRQLKDQKKQKNPKNTWKDIVEPELYNSNLNQLLDKISIQNRYSNRVTISNAKNIQKLQVANKELNYLKEEQEYWKDKHKRQIQLRQTNENLVKQIKVLRQNLSKSVDDFIRAQKQIKKLQSQIKELEEKIIGLSIDNFAEKKSKLIEVSSIREKLQGQLLVSAVKNFLMEVEFDDENALVSFCRKCCNEDCYDNFFQGLNQTLYNKKDKSKEKSMLICPRIRSQRYSPKINKKSFLTNSSKKYYQPQILGHFRSKTIQSITKKKST